LAHRVLTQSSKKMRDGGWQSGAAECNFYSFRLVKFCPLRAILNKAVRVAWRIIGIVVFSN
jgi:hypothetical protein